MPFFGIFGSSRNIRMCFLVEILEPSVLQTPEGCRKKSPLAKAPLPQNFFWPARVLLEPLHCAIPTWQLRAPRPSLGYARREQSAGFAKSSVPPRPKQDFLGHASPGEAQSSGLAWSALSSSRLAWSGVVKRWTRWAHHAPSLAMRRAKCCGVSRVCLRRA